MFTLLKLVYFIKIPPLLTRKLDRMFSLFPGKVEKRDSIWLINITS